MEVLMEDYKFLENDGWDNRAIRLYLHELARLTFLPIPKQRTKRRLLNDELYSVGSKLHTEMIQIMLPNYSARAILDIILGQLGATIDKNDCLQLMGEYQISEDLKPTDLFHDIFCDLVQRAYGEGMEIDRKIHQFRSYLDRQSISYIRRYKEKGMRDIDALAKYAREDNVEIVYEASRFHNKFPKKSSYQRYFKKQGNNLKYLINFHVEFIVSPTGEFISMWNVLEPKTTVKSGLFRKPLKTLSKEIESDFSYYRKKYKKKEEWEAFCYQIMNSESYNYANDYKVDKQMHEVLDMNPPEFMDSKLRLKISKEWGFPIKRITYRQDKKENIYNYSREEETNAKLLKAKKM